MIRRRIAAATLVAALSLAPATPAAGGQIDDAARSQSTDVVFDFPPIIVELPDLEAPGRTCRWTLDGSARVTRPSGGSSVSEFGEATGSTNCNRYVTTSVNIWDTPATLGTTYHRACQDRKLKSSSCTASQSVPYFSSSGLLTRPLSTITFRFQAFNRGIERICVEYKVVMVAATPSVQSFEPCSDSALA